MRSTSDDRPSSGQPTGDSHAHDPLHPARRSPQPRRHPAQSALARQHGVPIEVWSAATLVATIGAFIVALATLLAVVKRPCWGGPASDANVRCAASCTGSPASHTAAAVWQLCVLCMGPCTNDMGRVFGLKGIRIARFYHPNEFACPIDAQVVDLAGGAPIATSSLIIYLLNGYV